MKISEKVIQVALVVSVLLSIYLSVNIWLSSSNRGPSTDITNTSALTVNERSILDTFQPLRLVKMQEGNAEITNNENLINNVQLEMEATSFGQISSVVNGNDGQFQEKSKLVNGIELLYESPFLLQEYVTIYKLSLDLGNLLNKNNVTFSRIQIDFDKDKIRFLNYETKNIYETSIGINQKKILNLMNKEDLNFYKVSSGHDIADQQYYLSEDMQMKKYSYILASQPVTRFRNAFFNNLDGVDTNENSSELVYTSDGETLTADEQLGTIYFRGTLMGEIEPTADIYSKSFIYVRKLGSSMGNLRYFDRSNGQINYRTFVEGFPVFSEYNKGQVRIGIENDENTVVINSSIDTIQIPIPSEETVTLKSTEALLKGFQNAQIDTTKIQSMVIGYTWQTIVETKQVVDLTPEWYVFYENEWYTEKELLEKSFDLEVS